MEPNNLSLENRKVLEEKTKSYPSVYGQSVSFVNGILALHKVPLSNAFHEKVSQNLARVHNNEITPSTAHLSESYNLAKDSASFAFKSVGYAALSAGGALLNLTAACTVANWQTLQSDQAQRTAAMHSDHNFIPETPSFSMRR